MPTFHSDVSAERSDHPARRSFTSRTTSSAGIAASAWVRIAAIDITDDPGRIAGVDLAILDC